MTFFRPLLCAALLVGLPFGTAAAEPAVFDLSFRGLRVAQLTLDGSQKNDAYSATGRLESAGLAGALRRMRYDASVRGKVAAGRFTPARYDETTDTGRRQSEATMEYRRGVPQVKRYLPARPPEPTDLDPARQGGTVDPLTALYATMRDLPEAEACRLDLALFDGKRRSALRLQPPELTGDTITCSGEYRRIAGFSAEDMAEKTRFPFRLIYSRLPDGQVRVTEVKMETLYGRATMTRRTQ